MSVRSKQKAILIGQSRTSKSVDPLTDGRDFTLAHAVALAHAMVASVARAKSIRALSIKGPAADFHALRLPRQAADADVLIQPERFEEFCLALEYRGWHQRVGRDTPSILTPHSRTYIHDDWPCDIDVHRTFPGFFAEERVVFERLWSTRIFMAVANSPILIPSRTASAVIGALHACRHTRSPRHAEEFARIESLLVEGFSAAERSEFYDIARTGGALWVLSELIANSSLGPAQDDLDPEQKRLWTLNRTFAEDSSAVGWTIALKEAAWSRKIQIIGRALWVFRDDIPRNDPTRRPTRREAWDHQFVRWRRGFRALLRFRKVRKASGRIMG